MKNICKTAILILVMGNIINYAWSVYNPNAGKYVKKFVDFSKVDKNYNNFENKIKKFSKVIKYIKQKDDSFYRIGIPIYINNNMSIKYGYKGLNTYLSIGNGYISNLSKELLILGNNKTNSLNELDSRTKITTLLGCKYYVAQKDQSSYIPYGYKLINNFENTQVYENQNALGIGVFYDNYILKQDYEQLSALEKEQALLDTAVIDDEKILEENIKYNENYIEQTKLDTTNEVEYKIIGKVEEKKFDIEFEEVENSEIYLYFENLEYDLTDEYSVKVKYNDIEKKQIVRNKISSAYYVETPNMLFNLGYKDKHTGKITVELTGNGNYTYDNIKVIAVPMEKYEKSIEKLQENKFNLETLEKDYIKGNINNTQCGILQISTSYSKGWKAYVDGKEVEVMNVNTGFIGIALEEGEHEIYFKYSTPYIKIGMIFSILGILTLIIIIKYKKKVVK